MGSDADTTATAAAAAAAASAGGSAQPADGPTGASEGRKKPTTKAERRAIQEAQRAKKAAEREGAGGGGGAGPGKGGAPKNAGAKSGSGGAGGAKGGGGCGAGGAGPGPRPALAQLQHDDAKVVEKLEKKQITPRTHAHKQVPLFAHLPQYEREASLTTAAVAKGNIHPEVLRLGLKISDSVVTGTNARCVAKLRAFQKVITDFVCPPAKVLSRELETALNQQIQYLIDCRPQSMAMGNVIKWLKLRVGQSPPHLPEETAKRQLCAQIDTFVHERIVLADQAIIMNLTSKIAPGDVLMVYSRATVVEEALMYAHKQGIEFRVIVVDAGARNEGREMMRRIDQAGVRCTYTQLHALSYVMSEVSKVLLGASAMLLNGTLVSRAGTALVAMTAHEFGAPVLVCCETYKFTERVYLDSICYNELGDPDELVPGPTQLASSRMADWRDIPQLRLLNLLYDVTPMKYLTMVVTEAGVIPPTSVPVIVREDAARAQLPAAQR